MSTVHEIREALEAFERISADPDNDSNDAVEDAAHTFAGEVRELLAEPTNVQALALARLAREHNFEYAMVQMHPFSLPADYWYVSMNPSGFECGIAPDGSVSS